MNKNSDTLDQGPKIIFDRSLLAQRRQRAAASFSDYDFLFAEVGARLLERRQEVAREFDDALHIGPRSEVLAGSANKEHFASTRDAKNPDVAEENLGIQPATLDLLTSNMTLQWVNDLPGALIQARQALRPDGLFLSAMPGGETLSELRSALMQAELDISGGAGHRVSPMVDVRSLGGLLMRAGFALPVVDVDRIQVSYGDPLRLLSDLRGMGETNALSAPRAKPLTRSILQRMAEIYQERFPHPDGGVCATFDILFITAWAPHPDQPKPLAPDIPGT